MVGKTEAKITGGIGLWKSGKKQHDCDGLGLSGGLRWLMGSYLKYFAVLCKGNPLLVPQDLY